MSMKITIENDKNMRVSIENATPEESGKILSQVFGYNQTPKTEENIILEPVSTPVKKKMSPEARKNISLGIKKFWAKKHAKSSHTPKRTCRRINGAPEKMLTPSNQIRYTPFLGSSLAAFIKDHPNTPSDELAEIILNKLPVNSKSVENRVKLALSINRPKTTQ